ncbi:MAG: hypothetical protein IJ485_02975 [Lachnospiraceae bacterium]|nr:hypothetical protein [Lachnospiraceae bacterium]
MKSLLVLKENIRKIYSKYENYITPAFKFLLAFISLNLVNSKLGYMSRIDNIMVVLVIALLCSCLPYNFTIIVSAVFVLLHLYTLSMECAAVALCIFLLMFLLYFRLSPKDALLVLLTPICFMLNIPIVIPLVAGLLCSPASIVSTSFGVVTYYVLDYVVTNVAAFSSTEVESEMQKIRIMIDGVLNNQLMFMVVATFAVTILVVFVIRKKAMDYAWTIAMIAGAILNVLILLMGELVLDLNISIIGTIIGAIISVLLAQVIKFFVFNVDYTRTEYVQFEDDEYYYYVKAVPKITVAVADKSVKRINVQRKSATQSKAGGQRTSAREYQSKTGNRIR